MDALFRRNFDAARDPDAAFRALNPRTQAIRGTGTNDSAAAGFVGEYKECIGFVANATVTISNASPAVITDTGHGMSIAQVFNLTTTGGLPTGLSTGTNYFVSSAGYATNSYQVAPTVADAIAGTNSINTSSAGSGVHTRLNNATLTTVTNQDVAGFSLTAGDWDVSGLMRFTFGATTTVNSIIAWADSTSATQPSIAYQTMRADSALAYVNANSLVLVPRRFLLSASTNIFMSARANFGTSTCNAVGWIRARRMR